MWSRNPMPVATSIRPEPRGLQVTSTRDSLVSRIISASTRRGASFAGAGKEFVEDRAQGGRDEDGAAGTEAPFPLAPFRSDARERGFEARRDGVPDAGHVVHGVAHVEGPTGAQRLGEHEESV